MFGHDDEFDSFLKNTNIGILKILLLKGYIVKYFDWDECMVYVVYLDLMRFSL